MFFSFFHDDDGDERSVCRSSTSDNVAIARPRNVCANCTKILLKLYLYQCLPSTQSGTLFSILPSPSLPRLWPVLSCHHVHKRRWERYRQELRQGVLSAEEQPTLLSCSTSPTALTQSRCRLPQRLLVVVLFWTCCSQLRHRLINWVASNRFNDPPVLPRLHQTLWLIFPSHLP